MRKNILAALLLVFICAPPLHADNNETDTILSAAESLFKAMKDGHYRKLWPILSEKSKGIIIDDVQSATRKTGVNYSKESIGKDFDNGGALSVAYWTNYIENFNPDLVLEESKWEMGKINKSRTEIILRHKKAGQPALLKMLKEDGTWKVGLEETFRASRR